MIGSFCLSEPQSGSDARHMQTKAVRDGDYYVLNGTKNWISNGGEAGLYIVFASLEGEEDRSAAFLVEYWRFGIRCGPKEKKLGIRASATTQVFLQDCRVPVGNMLGQEGDGFKIAMASLDAGRIGIAAAGARDRAGCVRRSCGVRQGATGVRPADLGVPGHPVHAG
jgi:acyl-CoA dehydrogenase